MRPTILFCFLLLSATAYARLDETVPEIEARYGKPLNGVKAESPATVAGVYEKNGLRITVGFCQNKSCYEQFQKPDPKNPNSYVELSETERSQLIDANCKGCAWHEHSEPLTASDGRIYYLSTYKLSNDLVSAINDGDKKVFTIRSLVVENQNAEIEKKRQQESLKGF